MDIRKAIDEGRLEEAAAHLRPLSDQGSSDSSNDLAIVYRRMGQPANELFFAHRAFEQNRISSSALQTLLRALLVQGLFQSAARPGGRGGGLLDLAGAARALAGGGPGGLRRGARLAGGGLMGAGAGPPEAMQRPWWKAA